jgi:hypothetical protein
MRIIADTFNQTCAQGIGDNIAGNGLHIFFLAQGVVMVAGFPKVLANVFGGQGFNALQNFSQLCWVG